MPCLKCFNDFYADPEKLESFCPKCFESTTRQERRTIEEQVAEFRNEYKKHGGGKN
jgi:hypothetical protein